MPDLNMPDICILYMCVCVYTVYTVYSMFSFVHLLFQVPGSSCASDEEEEEEVCTTEQTGTDQHYDEHIDEAAEEEGLKRYREARANEMFPDEVDTPLETSARIRSNQLLLFLHVKVIKRYRNKTLFLKLLLLFFNYVGLTGSSVIEA